jgi:hypothetical protein
MVTAGERAQSGKSLDWRRAWRLLNYAAVPLILVWVAGHLVPQAPFVDDMAYWGTRDGVLYELTWNTRADSFIYSPAFAQVIAPFVRLDYLTFHVGLEVVQIAAVLWLLGPALTLGFLLVPFLGGSYIWNGNITPLLCVALVLRWWPAIVLTKILPGVTLGWYVGARDWRGLALSLWVIVGIVAVSFVLWPGAWFDWADALTRAQSSALKGWAVPIWLRLPAALALSVYAGHSGRRWLLAPAAMLSLADIAPAALVWLIAVPRLLPSAAVAGVVSHESDAGDGRRLRPARLDVEGRA